MLRGAHFEVYNELKRGVQLIMKLSPECYDLAITATLIATVIATALGAL